MVSVKKAMILAAGFGERARPLTLVRPKPLFPVLGRPVIHLTLERLAGAGVEEVVVNTHHLAPRLEEYLAGLDVGLRIAAIREEVILGTGGGLQNAAGFFGPDPFLVVNADVVTDLDLKAVINQHLESRPLATLVLHDRPEFNQVAVSKDGNIAGFARLRPEAVAPDGTRRLAFTGIQVVEPEFLKRLPRGRSDTIASYQAAIDEGRPVQAYLAGRPAWWDIGTLKSYLKLHADLLRNSPQPVAVDREAVIDPRSEIKGWAYIGRGAVVESGSMVKNSVLWPGARIAAGVKFEDGVAADNALVEESAVDLAVVPNGCD